jgi:hypothetical protein
MADTEARVRELERALREIQGAARPGLYVNDKQVCEYIDAALAGGTADPEAREGAPLALVRLVADAFAEDECGSCGNKYMDDPSAEECEPKHTAVQRAVGIADAGELEPTPAPPLPEAQRCCGGDRIVVDGQVKHVCGTPPGADRLREENARLRAENAELRAQGNSVESAREQQRIAEQECADLRARLAKESGR